MRRAVQVLLLAVLLAPFAARADERFDHHGAVGLLIGGGGIVQENFSLLEQGVRDSGARGLVELGGTWNLGANSNELAGWVRGTLGGEAPGLSVIVGYRGYFGYDRLKTFLDLDLDLQLRPYLTLAPRVGGGFQFELSSNVGVFAGLAIQGGAGTGLLFSAELFAGLQIRSYLLEP